MRYGMAAWTVEGGSPAARMEGLRALGFDAVSFREPARLFERKRDIEDVVAAGRGLGMEVTLHSAFGGPAEREDGRRDVSAAARFQELWGGPLVVTFDPAYGIRGGDGVVLDLEGTIAGLQHALAALGPQGGRVGVENWLNATSAGDFAAYRRRIEDEGLGMLLDVGHLKISLACGSLAGMTAEQFVSAVPLRIWEIHVHDNDGRMDHHRPCLEAGMLRRVVAAVLAKGDDPVLTVEAAGPGGPWRLQDAGHETMLRKCLECLLSAGA